MRTFEEDFEAIFETAAGFRETNMDTQWVPVLMEDGTVYSDAYNTFWNARENLSKRLTVGLEDADISDLLEGVMKIEREIARVMFRCGMEYAKRKHIE